MAIASPSREAAELLGEIESVWSCLDELFASFGPADWQRKLGPDWTYADLPYHLSYFDQEIVATPLARGRNVPLDEQRVQRTRRELDAWNASRFAQRPSDETVEQSLARMRRSRELIRRQAERMSDADLDVPGFTPLMGTGWVPGRMLLGAALAHSWAHYTEARLRLGRRGPLTSEAATHRTLGFFMELMPLFASKAEIAKGPFVATMAFTGPGGGAWTIRVADGELTSREGAADDADVVLTQSAETFEKTHSNISGPMWLMLTGQIRVKGFAKMGRFGKLMAFPGPDTPVEPMRARL
jgi:hypothetical protein